jgi:hypothetical protein
MTPDNAPKVVANFVTFAVAHVPPFSLVRCARLAIPTIVDRWL